MDFKSLILYMSSHHLPPVCFLYVFPYENVIYMLSFYLNQNQPRGKQRNAVNRGIDFLASRMEEIEDFYSLAITTYTLHMAGHPLKDAAFFKLEGMAKVQGKSVWYWIIKELCVYVANFGTFRIWNQILTHIHALQSAKVSCNTTQMMRNGGSPNQLTKRLRLLLNGVLGMWRALDMVS